MEHNPVEVQGRTYTRLEHVNIPVGDGYARCHYIGRYSEVDGFGTRYDTEWYRSDNARRGFYRKLFDALKGMLFWR